MIQDDLFMKMNDTLDNFTFTEPKRNRLCKENVIKEELICLDDSAFLNNLSFDFSGILKENKNSVTLNNVNQINNIEKKNVETIIHSGSTVLKDGINYNDNIKNIFSKEINNSVTLKQCPSKITFRKKTQPKDVDYETEQNKNRKTKSTSPKVFKKTGDKKYSLLNWGLPQAVLEKYESRKITSMFSWQVECLSNPKVINDLSNLIYSAPTSAGKTLVAEILALKTIFERNKKVIFVLPFVSIVREKMFYFQDILGTSGIRAEGFMGSYNPPGGFTSIQLAICTIEKANSLINKLLEEGKLSDIGAVLVDELHLLGDPHRGYLLELLLTKLRYISVKDDSVQIQIVGMSATLPNLDYLARWLGAELYCTNFRPIPLFEQVIMNGDIYDKNLKLLGKLSVQPELGTDTDGILQLCLETIKDNCSVLIFCPTKNWCENLANQIASAFYKIGNSQNLLGELLRYQIKSNLILEVLEQLKYSPVGLDLVLKKIISYGVCYHHAGLTMDERDIIESAFRNGAVRVLIATSTLSSGVNLPARRVIIRTPNFHGKPIDLLTYQQMIGRAGRLGKDTIGESFLVCQKNDYQVVKLLMTSQLPPIESCLEGDGKLKRALLEVIASGVASTPGDVQLFTQCTLLAVTEVQDKKQLGNPIHESINFLMTNEFIRLQKSIDGQEKYIATSLGKACLASSIAPDEGLTLLTDLEKARQCFVLETELHLIYLVTPYSACYSWGDIDWMFYLELWDKLPSSMKRVGELVGVRESYLVNATRGKIESNSSKSYQRLMIHKRFFVSLALQDLVNEKPLNEVCSKFNCNRGMLQALQQSASSFAGMVTSFTRQLAWGSVEILLSQFQDRMHFGVSRDLLDLMHLSSLNGKLARILYDAGIETMIQLANSDVTAIEDTLYKAGPFESARERDAQTNFESKERNKCRKVWISGREGLTEREAAELLINEARSYLTIEMGLAEAKWNNGNMNKAETAMDKNYGGMHCSNQDTSEEFDGNHGVEKKPETTTSNEKKETVNSSGKKDEQNIEESEDIFKTNQKVFSPKTFQDGNNKSHENDIVHGDSPKPNTSSRLYISDSESMFADISFTRIEENVSPDNARLLKDISGSPISDSILELNISKSSSSNASAKNNDSQFEASFSLQLSDDSLETNLCSENKRQRETFDSDESVLEATPTKKMKCSIEKSPYNTAFKRFSRLSLHDATIETNADFSKIEVVCVAMNETLFNAFLQELKDQTCFALSLACESGEEQEQVIGSNIVQATKNFSKKDKFICRGKKIGGVSFSWGDNVAYYASVDNAIHGEKIMNILKDVFRDKNTTVRMINAKEQIKFLCICWDVDISCKIEDPKVIDWLLDPEGEEKNLKTMVATYFPKLIELVQMFRFDTYNDVNAKKRSSVETVATWHLMNVLNEKWRAQMPLCQIKRMSSLISTYELEMKTVLCLAKMESRGMNVKKANLQRLVDLLKVHQAAIEKKAYSLAGRRFNFVSPSDVARVIGMSREKRISTKKHVLEKSEHPISNMVLQWRKINFTLSKVIFPLIRAVQNDKIRGCYHTHTATGRISMHEPNMQMVTKDFEVLNPLTQENVKISCRSAFRAPDGWTLISADYCQLELRILTYLSCDKHLTNIMKNDGDVFKSIAAKWNNVAEDMFGRRPELVQKEL
ncbi:DNA polymerase theta isoform X2 [Cylas formicarius]|uniref:DNA polymerase theta isoform X2 n=1 Tax=Cylas formicarius TaxID=197179 RepID=UPI002958653E|nr:DNA polymerase theta isoform X2 [Cylas formicarius]XP_060523530.1 DNA polymerase theta isoform X2 [Cylas formicarius]